MDDYRNQYYDNEDDFTPTPRETFHSDATLCRDMLRSVTSTVPLKIHSSKISSGSGLFVEKPVDEGREIYRSEPLMTCIDYGNESFCHYCLRDTNTTPVGIDDGSTTNEATNSDAKACMGCKVARFCSKKCQKAGWTRFHKDDQLRIRSLKRIPAGQEITICYLDPTIDVVLRQEILKREHFFDCRCTRCKSEEKEHKMVSVKNNTQISTFHKTQRDMLDLMKSAVLASRYPGLHPTFEDLGGIETQLRTIARRAFPASHWPDHIEPLPSARLSLAALFLAQNKPIPALRNALRGKLMSRRRSGPEYVNELFDVVMVLVTVGSLPPDAPVFDDASFPAVGDIRTVSYGYFYEMCKEAGTVFGGDATYTMTICGMFAAMVAKKADAKPGSKEFEKEFEVAQVKLMNWASIPTAYGIVHSC
ncbi:hypothetical protein B0H66DRAFT_477139 [Apodospora peruviana]|uniref:SET domain-containing protein n=1 Tax=Apodospora peruviana TaxID=516989 RepID=A0AAE0I473_9PEZI|nr:hypothetical protein B0H66DRAFT_477139 [Apodospora peruviana]